MLQPAAKVRILIVESLSPGDLMDEFRESRATRDVLQTLGIKCLVHECRSKSDLEVAARVFKEGKFDVFHLASHGCDDLIRLTDGTDVRWNELATLLGDSIVGKQLVLSACHGGCTKVPRMFEALAHKPSVIVGPSHSVPWTDLLVAWQVYYRATFPPNGNPDSACNAVSRVKMATGTSLSAHMLIDGQLYDQWSPTAFCGFKVYASSFERKDVQAQIDYIIEIRKQRQEQLAGITSEETNVSQAS